MQIAEYLEMCRKLHAAGETCESILAALRRMGADKIDSALVLGALNGIEFREAFRIVHLSQTWGDVRRSDEEFDEMVDEALRILARRSPGAIRFET